jgi:hypothetical protein
MAMGNNTFTRVAVEPSDSSAAFHASVSSSAWLFACRREEQAKMMTTLRKRLLKKRSLLSITMDNLFMKDQAFNSKNKEV